MIFIDPNGNYPRYIGDLIIENPNWDQVSPLPEGWIAVERTQQPEALAGQVIVEGRPEIHNGVYYQTWETLEIQNSYLQELRENLNKINNRPA